jgi:hypothetical protein
MKVAISVPEDVHAEADALAARLGTSRSDLYVRALRSYLARHSPNRLTDALDASLADEPGEAPPPFLHHAARRTFDRNPW